MPDLQSVDRVRRSLNGLSAEARTALEEIWAQFGTDRVFASQALVDLWLSLIETYGNMAASMGAAQFEAWAVELGLTPRVQPVAGVDPERATARLRWALSTPAQLGNAVVLLDELVKQPFRSVIQKSAGPSGGAWARVPTGAETCAFCLMLASRGAVYQTAHTAGQDRKYHGDCDCIPTLVRGPEDFPQGYDPVALFDIYSEGAYQADSGQPKPILAAMRQITGGN